MILEKLGFDYNQTKSGSGLTTLEMNFEFNILGRKAYLLGSDFETFEKIDDDPMTVGAVTVAKEETSDNVKTGIANTAVLAGLAVACVVTGGVAIGAVVLAGAAISVGSYTYEVAQAEKQGQQITSKEMRDRMNMAAFEGMVVGAALYTLGTKVVGGKLAAILTNALRNARVIFEGLLLDNLLRMTIDSSESVIIGGGGGGGDIVGELVILYDTYAPALFQTGAVLGLGGVMYQAAKEDETDKEDGSENESENENEDSKSEIKNTYNSIKDSPNYPDDFEPRKNGTKRHKVKNSRLLEELRKIERGEWKKVYKDGYDSNGNEISIHFFQSESGKVFDVKVKPGWSNP